MRATYLISVNKNLCLARASNNGRIPHGLVQPIVNVSKTTMPWLRVNIISKSFTVFMIKKQVSKQSSTKPTLL